MIRMLTMSLCLAGAIALAESNDEEVIDELEVRLSEIEVIDVTAEKQPVDTDVDVDVDVHVQSILDELESFEAEETRE